MAAAMPYTPPSPASFTGLGIPVPQQGVSVGGILSIKSQSQVEAEQRAAAEAGQDRPVIQSLAGHVRKCWEEARRDKEDKIEPRMLRSVRQRRGEYDPQTLTRIKQQGGSEIYMMLSSVKCRGATAWLRDVMGGKGDAKPWTLKPTPIPALPPVLVEEVREKAETMVMNIVMQNGGVLPSKLEMYKLLQTLREDAIQSVYELARAKAEAMERKMEDQLTEGGFDVALEQFTDDITTFPAAFLKGPVIRRKPKMKWKQEEGSEPELVVEDTLVPEWERVDPFMIYPSPASMGIDDGFLIERHKMRRGGLEALIGVEGYDENAIRAVLDEFGRGGLQDWLSVDMDKALAEGRSTTAVQNNIEGIIDALQFWGSVSGKMLREWGLDEKEVPDESKEYPCEVWLVGRWVIKASLNFHPMGLKPYYKASYEDVPGAFWGNSVTDLIRDCQDMCNSAARALANNMGISSGPQVSVLTDRLPPGEDISQMYPWKIWQFESDPMGGTQANQPIQFFQPGSNANELMQVYDKFSILADEYSGIPRYMTGDSPAGGAGRTASGMNMLMNNANKSMKQVVANVDMALSQLLQRLYFHNMKYSDDPALKGDVEIVAQGANGVLQKEGAQVRRNEFLAATANPIDMQIVGLDGRAELLRSAVKTLDIDPNKVVPSPERIRLMQAVMPMMGAPGAAPTPMGEDQAGSPPGGSQPNPTQNKQVLQNGAPITDNFSPK